MDCRDVLLRVTLVLVGASLASAGVGSSPSRASSVDYRVTVTQIAEEFTANRYAALLKYEGATVAVTGYVGSVDISLRGEPYVMLVAQPPAPASQEGASASQEGAYVSCNFAQTRQHPRLTQLRKGDLVTIAGFFESDLRVSGLLLISLASCWVEDDSFEGPPLPAPVAHRVTVLQITKEFEENEYAALKKYEATTIAVTGFARSIKASAYSTGPVVSLYSTPDYVVGERYVVCYFPRTRTDPLLATLREGAYVTVCGRVSRFFNNTLFLQDCWVEELLPKPTPPLPVVDYRVTVKTITGEFSTNEYGALVKYKGKVLAVAGYVGDIAISSVTGAPRVRLDIRRQATVSEPSVYCYFAKADQHPGLAKVRRGDYIAIVGRFDFYSPELGVYLDMCYLDEPTGPGGYGSPQPSLQQDGLWHIGAALLPGYDERSRILVPVPWIKWGSVSLTEDGKITLSGLHLLLGGWHRYYNGPPEPGWKWYWGWGTWAFLVPYWEFGVTLFKAENPVLSIGLFYILPYVELLLRF